MPDFSDLWDDINKPQKEDALDTRRADPNHPLDFSYGKDFHDRYVFCLDSESDDSSARRLPQLVGLELNLLPMTEDTCRLVLTLKDKEFNDLFGTLTADLMRMTEQLSRRDSGAMEMVVSRLLRWQEMLEKAHSKVLSQSKIIGLIGELLFLRDLMLPVLSANDVIHSWRGPYGDEQDFLLGGGIVEIKTQLSTSDEYLTISSENQLDTSSGPIMICHQTLYVPSTQEAGATSLNGIVTQLVEQISKVDAAASQQFSLALIEVGYIKKEEYDRPLYLLNTRSFLEVVEGFPRLSAADIPEGVNRVRYRVSLQSCKKFELDEVAAKEWIFNV